MSRTSRRPSRSFFARSIACLSVFLTVSVSWWPLIAAARASTLAPTVKAPSASAPVSIASARASVVDRVAPVAAVWRRQGGDRSAAVLFDGDQATSLRSEQEAVIVASLAEAQPIRGLGVFGQADGTLSVYLPDGAGMPGKPIAGLQDLDLAALPLRWSRFWSREAPVARDLVLVWRPRNPSAALRELEIFGLLPDRAAEPEATLADRLLAGTPAGAVEFWSGTAGADVSAPALGYDGLASFPVRVAADPRLVDRAFLVYELAGYDRWSAPRRQINGFGVVGGYRAEGVTGAGSVQVEEISPEWLFQGDNEIHFLPVDENDPVGYKVRQLRIVTFSAAGHPAAPAPGDAAPGARYRSKRADAAAAASAASLAAISDGDATTGLVAGRGPAMVTLPVPDDAQPSGLNVRVGARLTGALALATVAADGRASRAEEVEAAKLTPGWNFLSLDHLPRGAAVRLTWDAGRDGEGLLAEARLVTSPEPGGRGRRLVVSTPLHGECVDHEVYLRGFLTGAGAGGARPRLSVVDRATGSALGEPGADGVAADGAFALGVAEPTSARGHKWAMTLRARYADGQELSRDVPVETCADRPAVARGTTPSGPRPLIEDEGAPFAKTVAAGQADTIEMGGVRLDIPAGALAETTRITVRPMVADDVVPLNPLMDNITPDRRAFRMGPHNLQFKRPVRISVPYDRTLVPEGVEPNEMSVYYFDDLEGRWQSLPAAKARDGRVLVAETTHFTDFIAATLATPEHPSPMSNSSKMFADLKAGDPAAGVRVMAPPTPGPDGSARMTFPIDIPPGRNGMQPNVDLQYDSNGPDGLMGVGWSFPTPNIQVDTKFGSPRVRTLYESDHYLLNGEELVKVGDCGRSNPAVGRCPGPTQFRRRAEHGGFERILRMEPDGLENATAHTAAWTVTNQDGTTWEYGNTNTDIGDQPDWIDYNEDGIPIYWSLANIIDRFGNRVEYHYLHHLPGDGGPNTFDETLYLNSITYTRSPSKAPSFTIVPEYTPRAPTYSALSDAHLSKEIRTTNLLSGLRVMYGGQTFRHYVFTYVAGEFGKPLLQSIAVNSGDTDLNFYTYKFDYNTLPREAGFPYRVQFGGPIQWADTQSTAATLGNSSRTSASLSGFIGLGPVDCYPHIGAGMSGGSDDETGKDAFVDVNGDGLPDLLNGSGNGTHNIYLNGFLGNDRNQGKFTTMPMPPLDLSHSASSSRTLSLGLHFPGELGANGFYTSSHSVENLTIADMNGDGLPDLFNGKMFYCNQFPGSTCAMDSQVPFSSSQSPWDNGQINLPVTAVDSPTTHGGSTFQTDMVVRWTAPFAGTVQLTAPANRQTVRLASTDPYADDADVFLYFRDKLANGPTDQLLWNYHFAATDPQTCNPVPGNVSCNSTPNINFQVAAGDEFFFIVGAPQQDGQAGNIRNAINWNPRFKYISVGCPDPNNPRTCVSSFSDHTGQPIYNYNFGVDHRLAGGMAPTWTTTSTDTRSNGTRVATTTVRITGTIEKLGAVADDVKFQIVKLTPSGVPTVVWFTTLTAAQSATVSLDALNITAAVQGKLQSNGTLKSDQLVFQVVSDSPVEPTALLWHPVVTYQNYCAPDAADQQSKFVSTGVMPNVDSVNIKCTNTPSDIIGGGASQAVDVQYPAFRYGPESPDTAPNYATPTPEAPNFYFPVGSGFHTIRATGTLVVLPGPGGLDPQSSDLGQVVVLFHAGQRLLKKIVVPMGTTPHTVTANIDTGAMSLRAAEPFYATVISYGNHSPGFLSSAGGLDLLFDGGSSPSAAISPTIHILAEPPLPGKAAGTPYGGPLVDAMVGGFRQWSYGVHNNSYAPFATSQLQMPTTPPTPESPFINSFFPPAASSIGLGINPPDQTLPGSQGPLWRGRGSDDYIAPGAFHPGYTGSGAAGASIPPGMALRRSTSQTFGGGVSAGFALESNSGKTVSDYDLIDLTGDRIPDMIGLNAIFSSNAFYDNRGNSWSPSSSFDGLPPFGVIRQTSNLNVRFGIGLGSYASQMSSKSDASGSDAILKSSEPSFGLGYGTSVTSIDMMDINGDGYTDYVKRDGTNLLVRLGQGRTAPGFYTAYQSWQQTWPMPALTGSGNIVQTTRFNLGNALLGDGLRAQDTASNSLEMNIMGMGGGVSYTATRTMVDMIDMNGDGLPDRVMKLPGSDEIQIQFNQGSAFGAAEHWAMPGWGGVNIDSLGIAAVGLGGNDALAFSQTRNTSLNVGFPIFIPIIVVCLVAELSAVGDQATTNTQMTLQDINGDGLPDEVFKKSDPSDPNPSTAITTQVYAKLNPAGRANRLKTVSGPFGGFYDIEYDRAGNQVDNNSHTVDPTNHWVMSAMTVRRGSTSTGQPAWNAEPSQRTQYTYANGFYSRADRVFVGFANVTTTHVGTADQTVEQDIYDTSDVYHKGLLLKHVVRKRVGGDTTTLDKDLPVFEVVENVYEVRPLQGVVDSVMDNRAISFVPKIKTFTRSYEGGGSNPDAATMTREIDYDYENTFGALTSYSDLGDTSTTADDVKYTIGQYQDTTNYVIKPGTIVAKDATGTVLATRAPAYYAVTGKIATMTDIITGGRNPFDGTPNTGGMTSTWQFHYDEFGNLHDYTDPVGYSVTIASMDPDVATYPMTFQDSFGYTWRETHNLLTGALSGTTDVNGVTVGYTFDAHQRLTRALSPWDGTAGTQRLGVTYASMTDPLVTPNQPASAFVQYQNPEQSTTTSFADGWGRVFQTQRNAEVDTTGTGAALSGVIVSGKATYDEYGRVASQGMPQFVAGTPIVGSPVALLLPTRNPTSFTYDVLSRKTKITYPGTTRPPATNAYNLVSVNGVLRRQMVATDSNAQVKRSYTDPRNNVVLVETPNTIGGVLKNLQTTYAFDPFDRLHIVTDAKNNKTTINWNSTGALVDVTSVDTGKTFYDRDVNGNLARKQNAKGNLIVYHRTNDRLDSITYPTSATVTFNYGPPGSAGRRAGRLANRTDEAGTESYTYDDYGNITQTLFTPAVPTGAPTPLTYQTDYTYDPTTGTLRTVQVGGASETIAYSYNPQGLVNSVNGFPVIINDPNPTHYATKIDYDEFGKRTRIDLGNGVTTTYAYDTLTRRLSNLNTSKTTTNIQKLTYGYDQVGHVTTMANMVAAPPGSTPLSTVAPGPTSYTFGYDNLYQLKTATGAYTGVGAFGGRNYDLAMSYDEIGNITSKVQSDTLKATAAPGAPVVTQPNTSYTFNYTYAGLHPHGVTSVGSTQSGTMTSMYDADGNRLFMKNGSVGRDLTWNEEDRMSTVKRDSNAATLMTFLYRADGTRAVKRALNDTYYVSPHFVDRRGVSTTRNIMLGDERLASIVTSNTGTTRTFFYHSDHLQSANYTSDFNGTLVQHDEYFPFGETWVEELLNGDGNNKTPYLFSAKEQDESGLYYFGGRYFDARVSTWMNPDPALSSYVSGKPNQGLYNPANLGVYSYAYNSPLTLGDPTGMTPRKGLVVLDEINIYGKAQSKESAPASGSAVPVAPDAAPPVALAAAPPRDAEAARFTTDHCPSQTCYDNRWVDGQRQAYRNGTGGLVDSTVNWPGLLYDRHHGGAPWDYFANEPIKKDPWFEVRKGQWTNAGGMGNYMAGYGAGYVPALPFAFIAKEAMDYYGGVYNREADHSGNYGDSASSSYFINQGFGDGLSDAYAPAGP